MAELPSGTVTLLFTDIEGSTRLLHELGERYADILAEHRRVLREAFHNHGGVEVDTQGDAFFYAFAGAPKALAAAADAQSALAAGPVRVRIGIHTGEPLLTADGYVGIDVHRAARIMSAGHGGQVLVSERTRAALGTSNKLLLDLGLHRLKDLGEPEKLYQLGEGEFPPRRRSTRPTCPWRRARCWVGSASWTSCWLCFPRAPACSPSPGRAAPARRGSRSRPRPSWSAPTPTVSSGCRWQL
jgi:class 3 adenylate cyclase